MFEPQHLRRRLQVCLPVYALWVLSYELVGRYASHLPATDLSTRLDARIPFWPQWIWIYALTYLVPFIALVLIRDDQRVYRALVAVGVASCAAYLIYILYPVLSPRPAVGHGLSSDALALERRLDFRANQLPSLHVANAWILFAAVGGERHTLWFRAAALALASAIALSTLFVKQHIVLDVIAGVVCGVIAHAIAGFICARWRAFMPPANAPEQPL